jgi:chromosome segregation ATPase
VLVIAIIGWVGTVVGLLGIIRANTVQNAAMARLRAGISGRVEELQQKADVFREKLSARQAQLEQELNAANEALSNLKLEVSKLEKAIADDAPLVADLEADLAPLQQELKTAQEARELADAGLSEVQRELAAVAKVRNRLADEYKARFNQLREELEEAMERSPASVRMFYNTHRHTPFGAAAGYYAAEGLYAAREYESAFRIYVEVARRYPESVYAKASQDRVAQMQKKVRWGPGPALGIVPYKPLPLVTQ